MEAKDLVSDALGRVRDTLRRGVSDLTAEQLRHTPHPETNPIGWMAWHLTRVQDHHVAQMAGWEQLWTRDGWHAAFGLPAEPAETGKDHTGRHVAAFDPRDGETLARYHDAVYERTKEYLAGVRPADLERQVNDPRYDPPPTVGTRLVSVVNDNIQHVGQIAYLRGLMQEAHWYPA